MGGFWIGFMIVVPLLILVAGLVQTCIFVCDCGTITGTVKTVKLTKRNGSVYYSVKQRDYFGLWHNCSQMIPILRCRVMVSWLTHDEAEKYAQSCRDFVKNKKSTKIEKVEDIIDYHNPNGVLHTDGKRIEKLSSVTTVAETMIQTDFIRNLADITNNHSSKKSPIETDDDVIAKSIAKTIKEGILYAAKNGRRTYEFYCIPRRDVERLLLSDGVLLNNMMPMCGGDYSPGYWFSW